MVIFARKSLVLLPLLIAAAVSSTTWGQDAADNPATELFEGLNPVGEINPESPTDAESAISDAAVDASVDSPVDSLFDSSGDYIATVGTPGGLTQNQGALAPVPLQDGDQRIFKRRRLTGDWWGRRTALQKNGIRYRGRVTQYFFGVGGGIQPPVPPLFSGLGIAGGDTFEYTGNSRHDFLVDLDKFGGPDHGKFIVTLENLWGRFGNVSFETGAVTPAVFNAVQPVDSSASGTLYVTKIADNTIVVYTCDNGPHFNEWPDGGNTWFRSEKNTNWEGGYRVSGLVRWPGRIKAGTVSNEIMSHLDWVPTLVAAAGEPDVKEKLKSGYKAGDKMFKAHLDGYNFLPYLLGESESSPRQEFFYFSDDGQLVAVRRDQWKMVFAEQRARQLQVWSEPFVSLRAPKLFNLRTDPFERADTDSNNYNRWFIQRAYLAVPAQVIVGNFLKTFAEFPMRQKPAKFNLDDVMKLMTEQAQ
ncbi:MAG: sulfatase-like hydrolase/transferase [Planctomycetales bacterium]